MVVDGPLRGREQLPRVIGYIKSHLAAYLPTEQHAMVGTLRAGQRTPVFRIGGNWDRYSWYLRLPCLPSAPWAGIVRIECSPGLPVDDVIALGRAEPDHPGPVRVDRIQGLQGAAESVSDRWVGAGTAQKAGGFAVDLSCASGGREPVTSPLSAFQSRWSGPQRFAARSNGQSSPWLVAAVPASGVRVLGTASPIRWKGGGPRRGLLARAPRVRAHPRSIDEMQSSTALPFPGLPVDTAISA